jgi:hypothetical protein
MPDTDLALAAAYRRRKVGGEERDVLAPFAERRHLHRHHEFIVDRVISAMNSSRPRTAHDARPDDAPGGDSVDQGWTSRRGASRLPAVARDEMKGG